LFCMRPLVKKRLSWACCCSSSVTLTTTIWIWSPVQFALKIKTKPNQTKQAKGSQQQKVPPKQSNAIVKVLTTELFKVCSTTKVPHPDRKQNLSWSCCQCI
jgi:hypothetical protein